MISPASVVAQQVTLRSVAISGGPAPLAGTTWATFTNPLQSPAGSLVFSGQMTGQGIVTGSDLANDWALWLAPPSGAPSVIARIGSTLPGTTGPAVQIGATTSLFHGQAAMGFSGGAVVFEGVFKSTPTSSTCALWSGPPAGVSVRGIEGAPTGTGGTWAACFGASGVNSGGTFPLTSTMLPPPGAFPNGVWLHGPGGLSPLVTYNQGAAGGDPAPGTSAEFAHASGVLIDDSGRVLFQGTLKGTGVTTANDKGFWAGAPNGLVLVAREGSVAPDTGGKLFAEASPTFAMNGAGTVVFHAKLAGAAAGTDEGLWGGAPSNPRLLVRGGHFAPGLGSDLFLHLYAPAVNSQAAIAFIADLDNRWGDVTTTNEECVYAGLPGALRLVAREGFQAPGLPAGVQFAGFGENLQYQNQLGTGSFRGLWFSDDGRLVFPAGLRGPGVTGSNSASYWAYVPGHGLALIARTGEALPGGVAGSRLLSRIFVAAGATGADGATTAFNNAGEFAFRAEFADGSVGIFVATLPHVTAWPAPTATALQPSSGPGGTLVTITGTGFLPSATVTFDGVAADPVMFVDSTTLTAYAPYRGPGPVNVVIANPDGQSATLPFTYLPAGTPFTDSPLTARSTLAKVVHINELRQRIDNLRIGVLLDPYAWTDPTLVAGVTRVKALHLTDLRAALDEVYLMLSLDVPTYSDSQIVPGSTVIRATHIEQLRSAVVAIETMAPGGSARRRSPTRQKP